MSGGIIASGGGGGDITVNQLIDDYDNNISNYSQPTTAVASSEGTYASSFTTADDMTGFSGATGIGTNGNDNDPLTSYNVSRTGFDDSTYEIGRWIFNESFYCTTVNVKVELQCTSASNPHTDRVITLQASNDGASWTNISSISRDSVGTTTMSGNKTVNANVKYFRIQSTGGTNISVTIRLFFINANGNITAQDDFAVDDDISTTRFESASETNPNIYVDMGSSKIITHIGLYKHSNDTTTEVKIQHSNDALTWSDLKTITASNITAGTWEFDRFNVCYARYIRVYSTDVTNKVMAYSQIKIKTIVDGELSNHGHLEIDSSDSSLGHDGTSA